MEAVRLIYPNKAYHATINLVTKRIAVETYTHKQVEDIRYSESLDEALVYLEKFYSKLELNPPTVDDLIPDLTLFENNVFVLYHLNGNFYSIQVGNYDTCNYQMLVNSLSYYEATKRAETIVDAMNGKPMFDLSEI